MQGRIDLSVEIEYVSATSSLGFFERADFYRARVTDQPSIHADAATKRGAAAIAGALWLQAQQLHETHHVARVVYDTRSRETTVEIRRNHNHASS